jgi:opacity protein-like surface antigen
MKKTFLIALALLILKTYGQNHFIGIDAGIYWASIASKDFISKPNFKTDFAGGISYEYFFNKNVSIGGGIQYNSRGFVIKSETKSADNTAENEHKSKTAFNYVTLPLKLGFSFGNKFLGFAKIGVIPAILVKAQETIPVVNDNGEVTENHTENLTSKVRKMDIVGMVEIGGGYRISNQCRLKLSISYQHGFSSITTDNYHPNTTIRNRGIHLSLGLAWAITAKSLEENEE